MITGNEQLHGVVSTGGVISGKALSTIYYTDAYNLAVVHGYKGTIEQWLESLHGLTPHIGENGNWWLGETDTGVSAQGQDGVGIRFITSLFGLTETPEMPPENWTATAQHTSLQQPYLWCRDLITRTDGSPLYTSPRIISIHGASGLTPHIAENGNWFLGEADTGVNAQGRDGVGIRSIMGLFTLTKSPKEVPDNWTPGAKLTSTQQPYLWYRETITLTDDSQINTEPRIISTHGASGLTPHIAENGNWWLGETDTGVSAQGQDGVGIRDIRGLFALTETLEATPKNWVPNVLHTKPEQPYLWHRETITLTDNSQINTEPRVIGTHGASGLTPHVGGNGNWWIGETDTGVKAQGPQGPEGPQGTAGRDGKSAYQYAREAGYAGTEEAFAEALSNIDHAGKVPLNITWDGDTTGRTVVPFATASHLKFCKVSNNVFTDEEIRAMTIGWQEPGILRPFPVWEFWDVAVFDGCVTEDWVLLPNYYDPFVMFVRKPGVTIPAEISEVGGTAFPAAGVYFFGANLDDPDPYTHVWTGSLTSDTVFVDNAVDVEEVVAAVLAALPVYHGEVVDV